MTPRPYYRWKAFWFGLLVLAFLGWAWARSMQHYDTFAIQAPGLCLIASQAGGSVSVTHVTGSVAGPPIWRRGLLPRTDYPWFPPAFTNDIYHTFSAFAHWLLILLFLIPWLALLIRRHHRLKRLTPS